MPCYHPITAFKPLDGGAVRFSEFKDSREVKLRCGQCIGCRLDASESWAIRNYCESRMHPFSWFMTLTYAPEYLPVHGSLVPDHLSKFIKALRREKRLGKLRFFGVGEYGDTFGRPHYHVLVYGPDIPDLKRCNSVRAKEPVYSSGVVSEAWPYGHAVIGRMSAAAARYVSGYVVKKYKGEAARDHYSRVVPETGEIVELVPEFARMSNRPGIGLSWLERYWRDVYSVHDAVIVDGVKRPVPRYFYRKMDAVLGAGDVLMDEVDFRRAKFCEGREADATPERLAIREQCVTARIKFFSGR